MSQLLSFAQKQAEGLPGRLDDILDEPVTIQSVRWNSGRNGEYVVMTVVTGAGEVLDIMNGGMLILDALHNAEEAGALPCGATFSKNGNTHIII